MRHYTRVFHLVLLSGHIHHFHFRGKDRVRVSYAKSGLIYFLARNREEKNCQTKPGLGGNRYNPSFFFPYIELISVNGNNLERAALQMSFFFYFSQENLSFFSQPSILFGKDLCDVTHHLLRHR